MPYRATVRRYLAELQKEYCSAICGRQHTAELSYRPVLDRFIRNLAQDLHTGNTIDVVLEPRNQGVAGRPDWRIHDSISLGVFGYVEAKAFSREPLHIAPYQEQIDRYLTLGHKLVITDGIDFVFCMNQGALPVAVCLIDKADLDRADWSKIQLNPQFEAYMRQLFATPAPQQCDERKLVELVALRTRLLSNDICHCAAVPLDEAMTEDERQSIELLSGLRALVYRHSDHTMRTDRSFADFTAQVIMFFLLYAHRACCDSSDSPVVKEAKIRQYVYAEQMQGEALLPFRNLMRYLQEHAHAGLFISQWVDECIRFLSFVQMTDYQIMHPDYHQLFEQFLAKYDPKVRFDYGAYYTPKILADFVVGLTEKIANVTLDASIYDSQNTIIDPCCGTGSFLEAIVMHDCSHDAYNLYGLEILPAPYMLANYRMSLVANNVRDSQCTVRILLTNTLHNGLRTDAGSVEGKKQIVLPDGPLKLIIGNPPCSDSLRQNTENERSAMEVLMEDFRPPRQKRRTRQNTQKQINNPFMQFLRWSCAELLHSQGHAVLSMVVPLSFLEAESYRYARKYLCEQFSDAWIVAIDADARTGIRNNSLFHTMQGRAVIIFTRKVCTDVGIHHYHFLDYSGLEMAEKQEALCAASDFVMKRFAYFEVDDSTCAFVPAKPFDERQYNCFWAVSGDAEQRAIFHQHCSGIKLAPTALFTHVKASMLKRRSRELLSNGMSAAQEWFSGQDRKPDSEKIIAFQTVRNECDSTKDADIMLTDNIRKYSFRPYLTSNVLLWQDLLKRYSTVGGGGTRLRPEIIRSFSCPDTIGFSMAHAPKDINPALSQFVSFCWYYPDNDICTRGNSHIYMNQYVDKRTGTATNNINQQLRGALSEVLLCDEKQLARDVVFYVYAVLCSQVYLDTFEGALFTVHQSDKRARVPVVADRALFMQMVSFGEQLAMLEKADNVPDNLLHFDYDAICSQVPADFHLRNEAHPFDEQNEQLVLTDGQREIRIHCPLVLQKLNISGYDVIKNAWLKFYSYDFTHCAFTSDDMNSLLNLLNSLESHTRIVSQIDSLMATILSGSVPLILPD